MATKRLFLSCLVLMALAGAGTALWGQTAGFAYVANCGNFCAGVGPGDVSAYSINGGTGELMPVDRSRMLGAVVGKALEPLASGKGVIQVLVTLQ